MRAQRLRSCAWLLFIACSAAQAATPLFASRVGTSHQVLVPVDAEGRPGAPRFAETLSADATAVINERIASLRFEPARRGDQPVPSELSLSLRLTQNRHGDKPDYQVGPVRATPIVSQLPHYPAPAMRRGQAAAVMLRVTLAPEPGPGRVQAEVVGSEFIPPKAGSFKAMFEKSALGTLEGCCSLVETIDGQALSVVAYVPNAYFVPWGQGKVDMAAFRKKWAGESRTLPAGLTRARLMPEPEATP